MTINFKKESISIKKITTKEIIFTLKIVIITILATLGSCFIGLSIGHNIIINPKCYLPSNPTKQQISQLNKIKLNINKLRAEQYK